MNRKTPLGLVAANTEQVTIIREVSLADRVTVRVERPFLLHALRVLKPIGGFIRMTIGTWEYGPLRLEWLDQWFDMSPNSLLIMPDQSMELTCALRKMENGFLLLSGSDYRPIRDLRSSKTESGT